MAWKIKFTETAVKQLKALDKQVSKRIVKWLESRVLVTDNPRLWGSGLTGDKSGKWRYRIGDFRVVCEIQDEYLIIRVIKVAHRSTVYD